MRAVIDAPTIDRVQKPGMSLRAAFVWRIVNVMNISWEA
jgi:hypothetical protein